MGRLRGLAGGTDLWAPKGLGFGARDEEVSSELPHLEEEVATPAHNKSSSRILGLSPSLLPLVNAGL